MIMSLNTVWPAVQFQSGPLILCVPLTFEVVNADANIEAIRDQVRVVSCRGFGLVSNVVHSHRGP